MDFDEDHDGSASGQNVASAAIRSEAPRGFEYLGLLLYLMFARPCLCGLLRQVHGGSR